MKFNQISTTILISGLIILGVHQLTVKIIASKVDDALIQYNILDALVGVFAVSLVLIAVGVVASIVGFAKNQFTHKAS
ncbi:hypothetical protein COY25_04415 [Candidatus Uhrbacteria bacterium CG_4_10_14_0_2_um_filter_41_7]|nr:MAG: hypothetical protein COY25_04415 [Candidatus Uhrbacteria bacterium CG_4_10_14_0_2_um_filter_41_7]